MKWNGKELKEITEPQVFNPSKLMLVSDGGEPKKHKVLAIVHKDNGETFAITEGVFGGIAHWRYCSEIPEEPKPKLATFRQLAEWLAKGCGEYRTAYSSDAVYHLMDYSVGEENNIVSNTWNIRKWGDKQWHRPTLEYMGIKE